MTPPARPLKLHPANFTPATRTPWGGRRIIERYKADLALDARPAVVGESWELSVEPDFPSRLAEGTLLGDVIAADPVGMLGAERAASWGSTALLVKLLDAATPLSVQIHPDDDDPTLAPDESGKPESWYILDAEPGAGLYLGLAEGVDEAEMRAAIEGQKDVSRLLNFIEVEPGDFFVIEARTPHAIGPGLTLIEPQRVLPGRRGLTYRYWDWNRRYNTQGRPDPEGAPRPLHVDRALAVTAWERPRGEKWLRSIRVRAGAPDLEGPPSRTPLTTPLDFRWVGAERLAGTGSLTLEATPRLRGLTVVAGAITLRAGDGPEVTLRRGETAALPAALPATSLRLDAAHALLTWIP